MKTILITGAGGAVGTAIRPLLRPFYRLVLFDRADVRDVQDGEAAMVGDISSREDLDRALAGVDAVLHLAGCTTEAGMDEQISGNIHGAWNVFEAARAAGVERIVFASTHHVVGHYPRNRRIGTTAVLRPDSRYGLTKAFGEQVGAFFADQFGFRVLCIRIGFLGDKPIDRRRLSIWISARDLSQLIRIGIDHPSLRFSIVYGVSNNARGFFDNPEAYRLGYRPEDSADGHVADVMAVTPPEDPARVGSHVIGGAIADGGFVGDVARIYEWG